MKSIIASMIAAAGLMVAGSAMAADMPAESKPCQMCHTIETKKVGPAWKDVAAKYKDDKNAAATIAGSIKKGGAFGWKMGMMPARGGLKEGDPAIDKLAAFIAGLK